MIDLHCHIIPYVDDGAETFDEALELLRMMADQHVTEVCATPHLRARMFETPDDEISVRYGELKVRAKEQNIPIRLHYSREYHCDMGFFKLLHKRALIPMGHGNTVLCEFSHSSGTSFIVNTVQSVLDEGYKPLIAHVERYQAIRKSIDLIVKLRAMGAMIQVNAGAVAGEEGFSTKRFCRKLAKEYLIDVIGSDAHDPVSRPPYLADCRSWLASKVGEDYAHCVMNENPMRILNGIN